MKKIIKRGVVPILFLCNLFIIYSNFKWILEKADITATIGDEWLLEFSKGHNSNNNDKHEYNNSVSSSSSTSSTITSTTTSSRREIPRQVTIHWNDTQKRKTPPRIYTCTGSDANGMRESKRILASALPEFTFFDLSTTGVGTGRPKKRFPSEMLQRNYTNEYDVFVSTFSLDNCNPQHFSWLIRYYNGKFALFSGESEKDHPIQVMDGEKMHAFGPLLNPRPQQDFPLTYMQMTWWDLFYKILTPSAMMDPRNRPKGNQTHYMIYANSNCVDFREEAIGRLSEYGLVHCDGKCQGKTPPSGDRSNLLKTRNGINVASWWRNIDLYSSYRFCFVMEHEREHATYITEKIIMAFSAGCIPIYYGPEAIFDIFNSKAFVFYNISNPQPALDQVKSMEENKLLYEQMLEEPIVANGEYTIQNYFSFDDTIGNGLLKKKLRGIFGITDTNFVP